MVVPTHIRGCVRRGDLRGLAEWLENGGDANDRTLEGDSLLCVLALSPAAEPAVAKLLLDNGAQWEDGMHIVLAAHGSNADFIRYLCSLGADPNYMSDINWTPLHAAARCNVTVLAALLDLGGDPNICIAPEGEGMQRFNPPTPLMCAACSSQSADAIRLLLSRGADFSAMNLEGETAEDYAREALRRRDSDEEHDGWGIPPELAVEAEGIVSLLADVRAAGSWKRYVGAWRIQLLLLQRLCSTGRAFPVAALRGHARGAVSIEELEATSGCKVTRSRKRAPPTVATEGPTDALMARIVALPPPLVGKVASYWRTSRDPLD